MKSAIVLAAGALCLFCARPSMADLPPTLALVPEKHRVAQGEPLRVRVGDAYSRNALTAWPAERIEDLCIRGESIQTNLEAVQTSPDGALSLSAPAGNVTMLALELKPQELTVRLEEIASVPGSFLMGTTAPQIPAAPVRVMHYESLKSLVRVQEPLRPPTSSAIATSKVGHQSEIRLGADATLLKAGSDLPIRAYADTASLKNGRVRAVCTTSGETQSITLDRAGIGNVKLTSAGVWRIELQVLKRGEPQQDVVWRWFTATITFEVPAEQGK